MAQIIEPTQAGEPTEPMLPLSPEELAPHFPQLEILECLGRGGMGVVYKARQKSLNRIVALKLLAPERVDDPQFAARFEKEAQALAALNHPHIVAVYDFGQAGGFYYLLMEFVDGMNLRQLLQSKRLTPKEALSIVPPVCDALQCAHDHGIVHRDIKPENLLINKAGTVKIADFGIAKIVAVAMDEKLGGLSSTSASVPTLPLGTPGYAAPEQANGQADHRADIYSLGVVLYEMLTGERPKEKIEAPSKRVQIDIRIDEIVLKALEREPELRFATVTEFRTQVEAAGTTIRSPQPPPAARTAEGMREWSAFTWAALVVTLISAFAAFGILMSALRMGVIEGVIILGAVVFLARKFGLLSRPTPAAYCRALAGTAWVLSLPIIGFALLHGSKLAHGVNRLSPGEAAFGQWCMLGAFVLPVSGIVLWRAPARKRSHSVGEAPRGNPWLRGIFVLLLVLVLGGLLAGMGLLIPLVLRNSVHVQEQSLLRQR